ncbi:zinc uptake transcriptional repressor [compost metagenome]
MVFAICDQCGHVDEFPDSAIERRLKDWSKAEGFQMSAATVELHGKCVRCHAGASAGVETPVEAPAAVGAGAGAEPAAKPVRRARKAPGVAKPA